MTATFIIHDVGHGACMSVRSAEGGLALLDCGHNDNPFWKPSIDYDGCTFEQLIVSNFDEDHLSDFSGMMAAHRNPYFPRRTLLGGPSVVIKSITYNTSVTAPDIDRMKKRHGMDAGVREFRDWLATAPAAGSTNGPNMGSVSIRTFFNLYPFSDDPENSNDISLVSVIEAHGFKLVSCGDVERAGMDALLNDILIGRDFQAAIANADVLIAPHHGREGGYHAEAMKLVSPQLVIFSDFRVKYATQQTIGLYSSFAKGANVTHPIGGLKKRNVLTTRNDGTISISAGPGGWDCNATKG